MGVDLAVPVQQETRHDADLTGHPAEAVDVGDALAGGAGVGRIPGLGDHGAAVGGIIGFYDGALGPGTGSFLVFSLVGLMGYGFLEASAKAKIANFATNLGALTVFVPGGHVMWVPALVMAAMNIAGGYLGARTAVAKGARFIRVVFILVVGAFIVKIGLDVFAQFTG